MIKFDKLATKNIQTLFIAPYLLTSTYSQFSNFIMSSATPPQGKASDKKKTLVVRQTTDECERCFDDWWLKLPGGRVSCLNCYDCNNPKKLDEFELKYFKFGSKTGTSSR